MTHINVVLIIAGNLESVSLFIGDNEKKVLKKAEKQFVRLSKKHIPNWEMMNNAERKCAVIDSHIETEDGDVSVFINWPEVSEIKSKNSRVTPMGISADDIVGYMENFYDDVKKFNKKELTAALDHIEEHEDCSRALNDVIDDGIDFVIEQREKKESAK